MLTLEKFSIGVGDRFAHQAPAQLRACEMILRDGVPVTPVWNKSAREHALIGSEPSSVLAAAATAVKAAGWSRGWHVDADHIRLETVDPFIPHSDFFTIDVADSIGRPAPDDAVGAFIDRHPELVGTISIPQIPQAFKTARTDIERIARKFLLAVGDAGRIYRHIAGKKGEDHLIAEISMDETDRHKLRPSCLSSSLRWQMKKSTFKQSPPSLPAASTRESTTSVTSFSLKRNFTTTSPLSRTPSAAIDYHPSSN
jgi:hypothetical protein